MDSIVEFMGDDVPELLEPDFDVVIVKMFILWQIRDQSVCNGLIDSLIAIRSFSDYELTSWKQSCPSITFDWDYTSLVSSVYYFRSDAEFTFEFIQIRDWLIFIDCPMSLVYRVSRLFYYEYDFYGGGIGSYSLYIRDFIFHKIRGYVSPRDFIDLQRALLGPSFGGILQRMWAFRGFRLNGVPVLDCGRWFWTWSDFGYSYDITVFVDW